MRLVAVLLLLLLGAAAQPTLYAWTMTDIQTYDNYGAGPAIGEGCGCPIEGSVYCLDGYTDSPAGTPIVDPFFNNYVVGVGFTGVTFLLPAGVADLTFGLRVGGDPISITETDRIVGPVAFAMSETALYGLSTVTVDIRNGNLQLPGGIPTQVASEAYKGYFRIPAAPVDRLFRFYPVYQNADQLEQNRLKRLRWTIGIIPGPSTLCATDPNPILLPTAAPTQAPTQAPTVAPTEAPTQTPTTQPPPICYLVAGRFICVNSFGLPVFSDATSQGQLAIYAIYSWLVGKDTIDVTYNYSVAGGPITVSAPLSNPVRNQLRKQVRQLVASGYAESISLPSLIELPGATLLVNLTLSNVQYQNPGGISADVSISVCDLGKTGRYNILNNNGIHSARGLCPSTFQLSSNNSLLGTSAATSLTAGLVLLLLPLLL